MYQTMYFYDSIDKKVQLIVEEPDEFDVSVFKIYSKDAGQKMWILHAQGRIQKNTTVIYSRVTNEECKKIQERCEKEYDYEGFNEKLNNQGFTVGESVKWADHVWYGNNEVLVKFRMPTENENVRTYSLDMHPGILDACAQMFLLGGKRYLGDDKMFMVVKIDEFIYYSQKKVDELWCYLKVQEDLTTEGYIRGDYKLFDGSGICVAQANGKQVKIIDPERKEALRKVMEKEAEDNGHTVNLKLLTKLNSATQEDKASILSERFRYLFSEILKIPLQEVDIHEPLANMGMDSLVGYEMKTAIERELNIKMPMEILIQGTPITELAGSVLRLMNTNIAEEEDEEKWYREEYKMDPSLWIAFRKKKPDAKFRLFCIPYGAVGASMYRDWNEALPSYVDVCPIQFPGKETRITEKPIMTISEAVDCLTKVLADELDIPYAFYGHSVGALLAYRTTHKLSENDGNKPKHLFVGAYSSPTINPNPACERVMTAFHLVGIGGEEIPEFDKLMQLSDDDRELIDKFFAAEMERVNVNDTIRRAIEPVAFSEFAIVDSYHFNQQETVMKVPITAFYGEQDPVVTLDDMKKWEVLTEDKFELNVLTGDHFFIHKDQNRDEVLNMVSERIKQYI